jgi:ethanolamine ammonia-lyase small subunit
VSDTVAPHTATPDTLTPDSWGALRAMTPARIALGRAGPSLPTAAVLRFALAHAQARDAIHTALDVDRVEGDLQRLGLRVARAVSMAASRDVYLRRPDLGRRLAGPSRDALAHLDWPPSEFVMVIADGLSSTAVHEQAAPVVAALAPFLIARGWSQAPVVICQQGRVGLGDDIGELLGARIVAVMLGERPGLSSPASLGIYVTYDPRVGRSDAERNCISNIHAGGLTPKDAARKLAWLLDHAMARQLTGIALKDDSDAVARLT